MELMTRFTLSQKLGVHVNTIANYEKKGLPVIVMGRGLKRYDWVAVQEWLTLKEVSKEIVK